MDILEKALALIQEGIKEEQVFGDGNGANFIVYNYAELMVRDYEFAQEKGII
jgi:hypothetical protein